MEKDFEKYSVFGIEPKPVRTLPIIVGSIVLLFIIVIVLSTKVFIENNQPRIDLLYVPSSAVVTLDGEMVGSGETVLSAGEHEIRIEKYGFDPENLTVKTNWGEVTPVHIVMTPNTDETKNWYAENEDDGRIAEGISGYIYDGEANRMIAEYPVLTKLPVFKEDFYIYQQACDEPICILVDTNEDYFEDAIRYFHEKLDDDIGKYRFVFYDYSNPFLGEG